MGRNDSLDELFADLEFYSFLKNMKVNKNSKKVNIINGENIKKMKKYLKNIFINNGIYVSEKEMLRNRFQKH